MPINGLNQVASILGWSVTEINGHSNREILNALEERGTRPRLIIADTVKGKGVSYMQNRPEWHANWPDEAHEAQAYKELEAK